MRLDDSVCTKEANKNAAVIWICDDGTFINTLVLHILFGGLVVIRGNIESVVFMF